MSRTRYARSGALRIAYERRGALRRRRPWLVLIQGMGLDRRGWEPVLRRLRRHFRLVLMDNRGAGQSDRPGGSFGVADMAGDVVAVLDAAGIRRAHVLGASLGGMVAQELAIRHPERVDGLVLACTTPGWPLTYPMPAASVRLFATTRRMTAEAARRRHTENALSARSVRERPDLVGRLLELQASRPADRDALSAHAAAGARFAGHLRQARIRAARWSCTARRTRWSTRATAGCSRTAFPEPGSSPSPAWATCCSGRTRTASPRRCRRSCWAADARR